MFACFCGRARAREDVFRDEEDAIIAGLQPGKANSKPLVLGQARNRGANKKQCYAPSISSASVTTATTSLFAYGAEGAGRDGPYDQMQSMGAGVHETGPRASAAGYSAQCSTQPSSRPITGEDATGTSLSRSKPSSDESQEGQILLYAATAAGNRSNDKSRAAAGAAAAGGAALARASMQSLEAATATSMSQLSGAGGKSDARDCSPSCGKGSSKLPELNMDESMPPADGAAPAGPSPHFQLPKAQPDKIKSGGLAAGDFLTKATTLASLLQVDKIAAGDMGLHTEVQLVPMDQFSDLDTCDLEEAFALNAAEEGSNLLAVSPYMPQSMARTKWGLHDFMLLKHLHHGYVSDVMEARCRHTGTRVALKVYSLPEMTQLHRLQLLREVKLHMALNHPNVVQLYAVFIEQGILEEGTSDDGKPARARYNHIVLVQEFADGGNLLNQMVRHGGKLPEKMAVNDVLRPLLSALTHMHAHGIVHRDIKPGNILFDRHLTLKLADFGLSIDLREERADTRAGTLEFMAPEVLRCPSKHELSRKDIEQGPGCEYTATADAWGAGVLLYSMVTGQPPFPSPSHKELAKKILDTDPCVHLACLKLLSPCAQDLVRLCMAPQPPDRPTVQEMMEHPLLTLYTRAGRQQPLESLPPRPRSGGSNQQLLPLPFQMGVVGKEGLGASNLGGRKSASSSEKAAAVAAAMPPVTATPLIMGQPRRPQPAQQAPAAAAAGARSPHGLPYGRQPEKAAAGFGGAPRSPHGLSYGPQPGCLKTMAELHNSSVKERGVNPKADAAAAPAAAPAPAQGSSEAAAKAAMEAAARAAEAAAALKAATEQMAALLPSVGPLIGAPAAAAIAAAGTKAAAAITAAARTAGGNAAAAEPVANASTAAAAAAPGAEGPKVEVPTEGPTRLILELNDWDPEDVKKVAAQFREQLAALQASKVASSKPTSPLPADH